MIIEVLSKEEEITLINSFYSNFLLKKRAVNYISLSVLKKGYEVFKKIKMVKVGFKLNYIFYIFYDINRIDIV